ncbi:glutathione s-transferase omega 2 [Fusarium sporotrichioides]|uniref:Glutathione s-transferase omega 2 n=1 Tax=Fusarium sporotrichioides TaxID=5514 RepID=A0A395SNG6_FUSSP|nr:glutathione s-transferase omega 2 [Fusarium sporotrichioides]
MSSTFPQFLGLPKEIQVLIWEAAIRPPGDRYVHRFSIAGFPLRHTNRKHLRLQRTNHLPNGTSRLVSCSALTVPLDDVEGNINDSIYLSDSGLWTACKDSRDAMERRFKRNEWWSHIKSPHHPKRTAMPGQYLAQEDTAHTASYTDCNGVVKHITIGYERDLIHLDPRYLCNIENIDWFHVSNDIFQLVFDKRLEVEGDPVVKPSFVGTNIALDYDRSILDQFSSRKVHYREKSLEARSVDLFDMCLFLCETAQRTVWFIDHGLVLAPNRAVDTAQVREIFRSGNCIYTEVKREDIGVLWHLSEYDKAYDDENHTAFDMFRIFEEGSWELEDPSCLRVLACQPAPGRIVRPRKPWALRCHGHPSCEVCNVGKPVPRVRPSTIKREGSESSSDISESDLILFD